MMSDKIIATNRKARHDYYLLDTYEAGISLVGSEIKSIRAGHVSIQEAYVRIDGEEAWLIDAHISPYDQANRYNHEPRRPRKLLLHKKEIYRLYDDVRRKSITIIPIRLYLKNGLAKVEIATARGKKKYDKRQAIAERDTKIIIERQMRNREY
jgi:SsrA-binding protein